MWDKDKPVSDKIDDLHKELFSRKANSETQTMDINTTVKCSFIKENKIWFYEKDFSDIKLYRKKRIISFSILLFLSIIFFFISLFKDVLGHGVLCGLLFIPCFIFDIINLAAVFSTKNHVSAKSLISKIRLIYHIDNYDNSITEKHKYTPLYSINIILFLMNMFYSLALLLILTGTFYSNIFLLIVTIILCIVFIVVGIYSFALSLSDYEYRFIGFERNNEMLEYDTFYYSWKINHIDK